MLRSYRLTTSLVFVFALCGQVAAAERVALIIGNAAYQHEARLSNPVNDARLVSQSLLALGFTVRLHENLGRRDMELAIARFVRESAGAQSAVFYFAGHGMQPLAGGVNYLLPVDADIRHDDMLRTDAVAAADVMERLEQAGVPARIRVMILDACRSNRQAGRARSGVRGLARMSTGDDRTLVAFSTNDQAVALDGAGANSPYAKALARYLGQAKELPLRRIFELTADEVRRVTAGIQQPRTYGDVDSLTGLDGLPRTLAIRPHPSRPELTAVAPQVPALETFKPLTDQLSVGQKFRDCESDCPLMTVLPTGSMPILEGALSTESWVLAKRLAVAIFETSFSEWDRCVAERACRADVQDNGWGRGSQPLINVGWDDAQTYVKWLSARTGQPYRLLSSAEWEYAARAGSKWSFPWGVDAGFDQANCLHCGVPGYSGQKPAAVGRFAPNAFGLHDVIGNVWEWVQDCYGDSSSTTCSIRSLKGGSFRTAAADSSLDRVRPARASVRSEQTGFRVIRDLN